MVIITSQAAEHYVKPDFVELGLSSKSRSELTVSMNIPTMRIFPKFVKSFTTKVAKPQLMSDTTIRRYSDSSSYDM